MIDAIASSLKLYFIGGGVLCMFLICMWVFKGFGKTLDKQDKRIDLLSERVATLEGENGNDRIE